MHPAYPRTSALLVAAIVAGCAPTSDPTSASAPTPTPLTTPAPAATPDPVAQTPPPEPTPTLLPSNVDLRPRLMELGLTPRPQGARGTCSIFTTCEAIEFAHALRTGHAQRLSPEFLNWAGGAGLGHPSDGNFFHNAIAGFEKHGVCPEASMPYTPKFDRRRTPAEEATAEAARLRDESRGGLAFRWIVPWEAGHTGVNPEQLAEIRRVLALGYPVAAGSHHSRLLVGYRDDPQSPGGGVFMTEDSALNRFDEVTYEFVVTKVNDVFWVEPVGLPQPSDAPVAR